MRTPLVAESVRLPARVDTEAGRHTEQAGLGENHGLVEHPAILIYGAQFQPIVPDREIHEVASAPCDCCELRFRSFSDLRRATGYNVSDAVLLEGPLVIVIMGG